MRISGTEPLSVIPSQTKYMCSFKLKTFDAVKVPKEGLNLTSLLHLRQDFLATRNMTRIDVGLARSYVKLLLSSWKTYMCNLMAWYINK